MDCGRKDYGMTVVFGKMARALSKGIDAGRVLDAG
jgi:hypothetical protein